MIASPCINVCQMDPASGLCRGCFRTLDEIARWTRIDDAERVTIINAAARRRLDHDPWEGELRGDCDR
ncbi:MAG: DUF1289 domain-containing protein [Rhodocyclaceae bacterium]|jgi:hypothetical protein|nr:MAG: DUF1289 domain-containing protein [Rhodocyclaceae bacterium]